MKTKRRLFTALLILALLATLLPIAGAAAPDDGSITIHKFDYSGTDRGNAPNNGTELDTSGTYDLGNPVGGITFQITKLPDLDYTNAGYTYTDLTIAEARALIAAAESAGEYDGPSPTLHRQTETTSTAAPDLGEALFDNLPLGIYLVEEQASSAVMGAAAPFLVYLPLTVEIPDPVIVGDYTQELIYDVHVYPKNEMIYIKKWADETQRNIGQEVEWTIEPGIPSTIGNVDPAQGSAGGYYQIEDTLDARLTLASTNGVVVNLVGTGGTRTPLSSYTGGRNPNAMADYELTTTDNIDGTTDIFVDFNTIQGIAALAQAQTDGDTLEIVITTEINMNAALVLGTPIENSATLYFDADGGDPDDPSKPGVKPDPDDKDNELEVRVLGLAVIKVDTDDPDDYLNDAVFDLYWSSMGTGSFNLVDSRTTASDPATNLDGVIYWPYDASVTSGYDTVGTEEYVGDGYFYVQETKAPSGYQILQETSTTVHIQEDPVTNEISGHTWTLENIKLSSDFELPSTGGSGTLFYTVAGIGLIVVAGGIFLLARRKKNAG